MLSTRTRTKKWKTTHRTTPKPTTMIDTSCIADNQKLETFHIEKSLQGLPSSTNDPRRPNPRTETAATMDEWPSTQLGHGFGLQARMSRSSMRKQPRPLCSADSWLSVRTFKNSFPRTCLQDMRFSARPFVPARSGLKWCFYFGDTWKLVDDCSHCFAE